MNTVKILSAVSILDTPQDRALELARFTDTLGAKVRRAAHDFHHIHEIFPSEITGDYVSDLVAELTEYVSVLSVLLVALDTARAELDAASFPAVS